jgi:predicted  nucleic acid-binding Zn-ribbon protein
VARSPLFIKKRLRRRLDFFFAIRYNNLKEVFMITTDVFDKLRTLQDILAEKYELEEKIDSQPKLLSSQEELLARLKKEFITRNNEYQEAKEKVGKLKLELQEAESARERGEKGMDGISSHREYEALDKEIKDATEREQKARKELQREEKNLAEINDRLKQEEEFIQSQETELNSGKETLAKEVKELQNALSLLIESEQRTNQNIDSDIIFKFERIIRSKHGRGIVAVKGNVCDGCHMILPAQFANKVRKGDEVVFCPYCSRILYYQELESGEAEYFHVEDTGSLADFDADFGEDDLDDEEAEETVDIADDDLGDDADFE